MPGLIARDALKNTPSFAETISTRFAAFTWECALQASRSTCAAANRQEIPRQVDPNHSEHSNEIARSRRTLRALCNAARLGSPGQDRRTRGVTQTKGSKTPK